MKKYPLCLSLAMSVMMGITFTACSGNSSKAENTENAINKSDSSENFASDTTQIDSVVASVDTTKKVGQPATKLNPELVRVVKEGKAIAAAHKSADTAVGKKSKGPSDATGFVLISDVIPDVIMEARYYSEYNFVGQKIDGYEEPVVLCTREAAAALKAVADEMRTKGYLLKIFDGYRPQKAVDHFCRWSTTSDAKMKQDFYPSLAKNQLFPTYVARKSGHTRGSTFDMTITDKNGNDVDMGGTFDFFGTKSHYDYSKVTPKQATNRKLLHDVMMAHGFNPYSSEWWHFTLKNEPYPSTYFTFPVTSKLFK